MLWRVEIKEKDGFFDAVGESVKKDIQDLGFAKKVKDVKAVQVYLLEGDVSGVQVKKICEELLIDPITQDYSYSGKVCNEKNCKVVEVAYNPGVMDPVEDSAKKAVLDLGITGLRAVNTTKKYVIKGNISYAEIHSIAEKILYNKVIQHLVKGRSMIAPEGPPYKFKLIHAEIINASNARLKKISKDMQLYMSLDEMRTIKKYFKKLGRNPTNCELETLAQTWSEHCKHKTFRGMIEFEGETIDNLLKSTVMKVTQELNKPWCVSVFTDNSGVIRFDEKNNICFKVETHNHPSALEPYGGAGTGIGGVIRDPLGTGLGAKPIINTDIFCFARPDYPYKKLPKGALHPKRVMKGVVAGVRDYGNRMGIPTSNGAVLFDDNFVGNPLVFCGNVGIMPKDKTFKKVNQGDLVVVVGGRTGRDGIHGATFSSAELTHESEVISGSAVQIGNPIQEKKMADTIIEARDKNLYNAITDCGAGGLSSAVGEMAEEIGAVIHLEKVPLKYKGLSYDEIWISEAQERMVLAVDHKNINKLQKIFERENVEMTVIGKFGADKRIKLYYEGNLVCDLDVNFMHNGVPNIKRKAVWKKPAFKEPKIPAAKNLTPRLIRLMSDWNIASKEWIIRQYDHEVQGGSVLKPLQGINADAPGDASITKPILDSKKGIVLSCGINPDYGKIDPYWMAASAIDEALRQVVSVGGDIERCAILDNFCWGNTNKPDRLGGLVRASRACYDIAKVYETPFISGKDSLNNEYTVGKKSIAIPPTLLISCIGVMDDVGLAISMDFKEPHNLIYVVGNTFDELGGSKYYKLFGSVGSIVPKVYPKYGKALMTTLSKAMKKKLVRSCHDCSEGGLAVTLAEMAFAGGLGVDAVLKAVPGAESIKRDDNILFSESNTRFVVEISRKDKVKFEKLFEGFPVGLIGKTVDSGRLKIRGLKGNTVIDAKISELKEAWQKPFSPFM